MKHCTRMKSTSIMAAYHNVWKYQALVMRALHTLWGHKTQRKLHTVINSSYGSFPQLAKTATSSNKAWHTLWGHESLVMKFNNLWGHQSLVMRLYTPCQVIKLSEGWQDNCSQLLLVLWPCPTAPTTLSHWSTSHGPMPLPLWSHDLY